MHASKLALEPEVLRRASAGETEQAIALALQISSATVCKLAARTGVKFTRGPGKEVLAAKVSRKAEMVVLRQNGATLQQIADIFSISKARAHQILSKK